MKYILMLSTLLLFFACGSDSSKDKSSSSRPHELVGVYIGQDDGPDDNVLIIISEDGGVYIYRPNDIKWNRGVGDKNEWEIQDNQFCLKWDQGSQGWFCRDYSIKKDKVYLNHRRSPNSTILTRIYE